MTTAPRQPDKFSQKWRNAGAEAQRRVAGKPIVRVLWESAIRKDETFQADNAHFDTQRAFAAWLQGWTKEEIQNQLRPKHRSSKSDSVFFKDTPRTPEEIEALRKTIRQLVELSPSAEDMNLYSQVHDDKQFIYACHVVDVLDWMLGKISTEDFLSDAYLNLEYLREIMKR
jgi:hypothetical protein